MNSTTRMKATVFLLILALGMLATETTLAAPVAPPAVPNPVAILLSLDYYEQSGKHWTRYNLYVTNYTEYPSELFAPAPKLPPCGANTNAARTWVEIFSSDNKRLYGFCALAAPADLTKLWFALETDIVPPSWVYIVLNDRQTGKTYKSNLVETTQ